MSRSNRTDLPNPAKKFFEWSAGNGELRYYDKEAKQNVNVKLPFTFMVLDEVSQVGGGTKRNGNFEGFWSNAVKNLKTQELVVQSKGGVEARGLYADIKDKKGFNYVKGLYIAYKEDDQLVIGFLKFKGSSLGAWFDYTKTHRDIYDGSIVIKSASEPIKGEQGDYHIPVFVHKGNIAEETELAAQELDASLQEYLTRYFAQQGIESVEHEYTGMAMAATNGSPQFHDDSPDAEEKWAAPDDDDMGPVW